MLPCFLLLVDIVVQCLNDFSIKRTVVVLRQLLEHLNHLFGIACRDGNDLLFHVTILQPMWLHVKHFHPTPTPNKERPFYPYG
jgi:hypothetical protein